jgi:hypothetical protein
VVSPVHLAGSTSSHVRLSSSSARRVRSELRSYLRDVNDHATTAVERDAGAERGDEGPERGGQEDLGLGAALVLAALVLRLSLRHFADGMRVRCAVSRVQATGMALAGSNRRPDLPFFSLVTSVPLPSVTAGGGK